MNEVTKEKIWEPLFTTKEADRGTGLGLPTVMTIVQKTKGFIEVESAPAQGTTFHIYLPRHAAGTRADKNKHLRVPDINRSYSTILVVDDDSAVLMQIDHMLRRQGYHVQAASSSEEALIWLKRQESPPNLVMTDVAMPGISGVELAEIIRAEHPSLKILYMSGCIPDALTSQVKSEGRAFFLQKPFSMAELNEKLWHLLESPQF